MNVAESEVTFVIEPDYLAAGLERRHRRSRRRRGLSVAVVVAALNQRTARATTKATDAPQVARVRALKQVSWASASSVSIDVGCDADLRSRSIHLPRQQGGLDLGLKRPVAVGAPDVREGDTDGDGGGNRTLTSGLCKSWTGRTFCLRRQSGQKIWKHSRFNKKLKSLWRQ